MSIKQNISRIKNTWTYNHKLLIVTIALAVAHVYPLVPLPTFPQLEANVIHVVNPSTIGPELEKTEQQLLAEVVEQRAIELHELNRNMDLEKYRHEAIRELNIKLQVLVGDSPFVDYDELKERFGY